MSITYVALHTTDGNQNAADFTQAVLNDDKIQPRQHQSVYQFCPSVTTANIRRLKLFQTGEHEPDGCSCNDNGHTKTRSNDNHITLAVFNINNQTLIGQPWHQATNRSPYNNRIQANHTKTTNNAVTSASGTTRHNRRSTARPRLANTGRGWPSSIIIAQIR